MNGAPNGKPLVAATNVKKHFPIRGGLLRRQCGAVRAVDGVDISVVRGETLGLVGESGSGKSTLARILLRLVEPTEGSVLLEDLNLLSLDKRQLREVRHRMQMVFQDPYSSLSPRMSIGAALDETLLVNHVNGKKARRARVAELLQLVGLSGSYLNRYPHELSGGQRQRVGIARALASNPELLICDEAIAALDVSIQAQIVNLLLELRESLGLSYLFISHDVSMVRFMSDRIAVMYAGKIVEQGAADELGERPLHPYTVALLSAVPEPDPVVEKARKRAILHGDVPSPTAPPPGCRFHPRCRHATDECRSDEPPLRSPPSVAPGHCVSCHHPAGMER